MRREILCESCHEKSRSRGAHPEDVANGWLSRSVRIKVKKPDVHGITIDDVFESIKTIRCDHCNVAIADGQEAYAVTEWNTNREGEPFNWEQEYSA
jgi:hypothetical protein